MVVIVRLAGIVHDSARTEEYHPAQIKRFKIMYAFANQQQDDVRHYGHDQAGCRNKLIGVHFPRVVYFCKIHMLLF